MKLLSFCGVVVVDDRSVNSSIRVISWDVWDGDCCVWVSLILVKEVDKLVLVVGLFCESLSFSFLLFWFILLN